MSSESMQSTPKGMSSASSVVSFRRKKPRFQGEILCKTSNTFSSWRHRWLYIDGCEGCIVNKKGDKSSGYIIALPSAKLDFLPQKNQIDIRLPVKLHATKYYIRVKSANEFQCWMTVLKRAQTYKEVRRDSGSVVDKTTVLEGSLDDAPTTADLMRGQGRSPENSELDEDSDDESVWDDRVGADDLPGTERDEQIAQRMETLVKQMLHMTAEMMADTSMSIAQQRRVAELNGTTADLKVAMLDYTESLEMKANLWYRRCTQQTRRRQTMEATVNNLATEQHRLEIKSKWAAEGLTQAEIEHKLTEGDSDSEDIYYDAMEPRKSLFESGSDGYSSPKPIARRTHLPADRSQNKFSVWKLLKDNIGKDLSKIAMPVVLNEPLSALQRFSEDLEYSHLLDLACETEDPALRIAYVAVFAIASNGSTVGRLGKPFNPLLGETFELLMPELGFRAISEQVSHHPPISAHFAEGQNGWQWWKQVQVKNKFRGKDMDVFPAGHSHVRLKAFDNEHYTWEKNTTTVVNVIVGTMWIDNSGEIRVQNHQNGFYCIIKMKRYSYFAKTSVGRVEATVYSPSGQECYVVDGKWTDALYLRRAGDAEEAGRCVWKRNELPVSTDRQFNFTSFAMMLNEAVPGMKSGVVAPTDSRLRPDQRFFEGGDLVAAQKEKSRLEEKQRAARRMREANGTPISLWCFAFFSLFLFSFSRFCFNTHSFLFFLFCAVHISVPFQARSFRRAGSEWWKTMI